MKKFFRSLLAFLLCFTFASCDAKSPASSSDGTSATPSSNFESTSAPNFSEKPSSVSDDLESTTVGKHVTLRYNANAVDITCQVKKGVGSKETVTISAAPKNGYTFDGFTESDALVNGAASVCKQTTYTFTTSAATTVFINSSFMLTYHANGGQFKNGFDGTDTFSAVFFLNPTTLHENGYFARDGYTLVGYNTKEDGTGEYVSLGSKVNSYGKGAIDLFCVWEENTSADQFTYAKENGGISIVRYNGSAETVTIPETIEGQAVIKISTDAFLNSDTIKKIVVAKSVKIIARNAFNHCSALENIVIFDQAIRKMADDCFKDCTAVLHINSVYELTDQWFTRGAAKFDRLTWAKNKKKIIIVGGSGSLYGFNSAVLDETFGDEYEIVNLGENANITSVMYFDIIEEFITEGDIILWCPEASAQALGSSKCHTRFWEYRKADYGFMQYLNLSYYSNIFSAYADNCAELAVSKFKDFDRIPSYYSKYGDDLTDRKSKGELYSYSFSAAPSAKGALTELFNNIHAKGGTIFFSFAAMQESGAESVDKSHVNAYEKRITDLPGVISISEYENCIYEDKYFYDSMWHMTDEGAILRTERVAQDLLRALGKKS
jgi:hypothetical protein